ncbi:MAG: lipocalin-like domain-containing protein [Bacteroidales bacterium]|nr:lipocalin-like domain-containing protein [Bacteroidales bacterium]
MKKVLFLLLAVVLIAPSCKKEIAPTIEGKWHLYKSATVTDGNRQEKDENSYYEFAGGIVKDTNKYGYTNEFPYTFDKDNKKLTVGTLEYSVQKLTAKEMVWRFDGTTMTVIDGELVKIDEEHYSYFRKE